MLVSIPTYGDGEEPELAVVSPPHQGMEQGAPCSAQEVLEGRVCFKLVTAV